MSRIESAQGVVTDRFAFSQTMLLDEFVRVAGALRPSGYRPTRFRPYADARAVRVAAVWTRDGRSWLMAHDLSSDAVRQADERNRKEGYLPVDVAGYLADRPGRQTDLPLRRPVGAERPGRTTTPGWSVVSRPTS